MAITKKKTARKPVASVMTEAYLDNAATTPVDQRVFKAMLPYMTEVYANPSSLHSPGQKAGIAVREAREKIAAILNGHANEIVFTSGGTESDSLAVVGVIKSAVSIIKTKFGIDAKPHVVTTAIEHHAVLEPLLHFQKLGEIELTIVSPHKKGIVNTSDIMAAVNERTVLVSVMYANNEIGTIQPIDEIGRNLLRWRKDNETVYPYFHSDACQAAAYLDLNVEKMHTDLLTLNGGKIYGPKGIGILFVRRGIKLQPLVRGGGQERGLRSGTENVPGIIGLSLALEIAQNEKDKENKRLIGLRDVLIEGLLEIPKSRLNGDAINRLSNNVNISFLDIEGEAAMLYLDAKGVYCSTGSACASTELEPSHVIRALGLSYEAAHGSLRFSLGRFTTKSQIKTVIKYLPGIIQRLRQISPVVLDMSYFD